MNTFILIGGIVLFLMMTWLVIEVVIYKKRYAVRRPKRVKKICYFESDSYGNVRRLN